MKNLTILFFVLFSASLCFAQQQLPELQVDAEVGSLSAHQSQFRSSAFNDTILFKFDPQLGFSLQGGTGQAHVTMHFENQAEDGRKHSIQSTGGDAGMGPGKFLLRDSEITLPLMVFDSLGRMGLRTASPNPSAALDINSTKGGLLLPRLTPPQIDAIADPPEGMILYDRINKRFLGWNDTMMVLGTRWLESAPNSTMYLDSTFAVGIGTDDPQAKLHVNGDMIISSVKSGSGFRPIGANANGKLGLVNDSMFHSFFNDTILFTNVSPLEFKQSSGSPALIFGDDNITCSYGDPGIGTLIAPLSLTSSCISDSFMLRFVDANPGGNMNFEFLAVKNDGTGMQTLASHTTVGSDPAIREYAMAIPGNPKIDLVTYSYYLRVSSGDWGGNLQIGACTFLAHL